VLLKGFVQGMGREAQCEVLARRLPIPADQGAEILHSFIYADCSVVAAPPDLPDGEYLACFEGYSLSASLHRGLWFSRGPASPAALDPLYD